MECVYCCNGFPLTLFVSTAWDSTSVIGKRLQLLTVTNESSERSFSIFLKTYYEHYPKCAGLIGPFQSQRVTIHTHMPFFSPYLICTWSFLWPSKCFLPCLSFSMNPCVCLALPVCDSGNDNGFLFDRPSVIGFFSWSICLFYFVYNVVNVDKLMRLSWPWCFWSVTHEVDIYSCKSQGMRAYVYIYQNFLTSLLAVCHYRFISIGVDEEPNIQSAAEPKCCLK